MLSVCVCAGMGGEGSSLSPTAALNPGAMEYNSHVIKRLSIHEEKWAPSKCDSSAATYKVLYTLTDTVNILKICELFVHFKSYLLKFRRQFELLSCLCAKIRAFCEIGGNSAAIFRKAPYRNSH